MNKKNMGSGDRMLTILNLLTEHRSISVAEAAVLLDIDKSNAYRLLKKLEEYGYAEKSGQRYYRGNRLNSTDDLACSPYALADHSEAILKMLVQQTNISAHLCMLSRGGATFIRQEFSRDIIHIVQPVGKEEPFHCTASGKVMLAHLPGEIRERLIERIDFKAYTENTITTKEELIGQLEQIRQQGYALDEAEFHPNIRCMCVPIYDSSHMPRYALGLSKLIINDEVLDIKLLKKVLTKYAARLSEYLCAEPVSEKAENDRNASL